MARRVSLLSGLAMLGLAAAVGMPGIASARELARSPQTALPSQLNVAPVHQNTVSTAVSVGSNALATAANQNLGLQTNTTLGGSHGAALQLNQSPTVQTAVSAAVSVGGNAAALSSNNGPLLGNATGIGLTKPVPLLSLGPSPSTSTAVSTAVSIDGVSVPR
jgi:hypothetical protein